MKKAILSALILILVLTACAPSSNQNPTPTEGVSPSDTPVPSIAPTATPTPTPTPADTLTPTPDVRVVDGDPSAMLLTLEDLAVIGDYYLSNHGQAQLFKPPYRNQELINSYGEKASQYITDSGRIDGAGIVFGTNGSTPDTPEFIISEIVLFATDAGPGVDNTDVSSVDFCELSSTASWKPVDVGREAFVCYTTLTSIGEWTKALHQVRGAYRNITYQVTVFGREESLSKEVVIEISQTQLNKIMSFPLADQVSYSP